MGPSIVTAVSVVLVAIIGGIFTSRSTLNRSNEHSHLFVEIAEKLSECERERDEMIRKHLNE